MQFQDRALGRKGAWSLILGDEDLDYSIESDIDEGINSPKTPKKASLKKKNYNNNQSKSNKTISTRAARYSNTPKATVCTYLLLLSKIYFVMFANITVI